MQSGWPICHATGQVEFFESSFFTNALSQVTTFAYDAAGNQTSVLDANHNTTTYTYDALNRRTQVTYPDSTFETTAYDVLGRVTSRSDANGKTTQYGYDALGRLTSVTEDAAAGGLNLLTSRVQKTVAGVLKKYMIEGNNPTSYQGVLQVQSGVDV
jgi:YD repeat-containing protein